MNGLGTVYERSTNGLSSSVTATILWRHVFFPTTTFQAVTFQTQFSRLATFQTCNFPEHTTFQTSIFQTLVKYFPDFYFLFKMLKLQVREMAPTSYQKSFLSGLGRGDDWLGKVRLDLLEKACFFLQI